MFARRAAASQGDLAVDSLVRLTHLRFRAKFKTWLGTLLAIVSLTGVPAGLVAAQQAATPVANDLTAPQLDLAALTIRPSDMQAIGVTGFGLANWSSLRDAPTDAALQAPGDEAEMARRLAIYRQTGYRFRYVGSLLRPKIPLVRLPSGLLAAYQRIDSSITEFATAEGAAQSFAILGGGPDHVEGREVPDAREFGDDSVVTRMRGRDGETGERFNQVELSFRRDNLVAEIAVTNFNGSDVDLAFVEQLGDLLVSKMDHAQTAHGPQLSSRVLRVEPFDYWIRRGRHRDFYLRLNGTTDVMFAEIAQGLAAGLDLASASTPEAPSAKVRPVDTYMYWTPVGKGSAIDLPLYVSWIDRYSSPQQAATALAATTTGLGSGYTDVRELGTITEPLGDGVRSFAYRYADDPIGAVTGYVVIVQVGDYVIRVQADSPVGVRREGVVEMARRQTSCLATTDVCLPIHEQTVTSVLAVDASAELAADGR